MPITINDGQVQRSRVFKITAPAVDFPSGALIILMTLGGTLKKVVPNQSVIGSDLVMTFVSDPQCEHGSLPDGRFWVVPVQGHSHRLFGDSNGDRTVDSTDFLDFSNTFGLTAGDPLFKPEFDQNQDSTIDSTDFLEFSNRFGVTV